MERERSFFPVSHFSRQYKYTGDRVRGELRGGSKVPSRRPQASSLVLSPFHRLPHPRARRGSWRLTRRRGGWRGGEGRGVLVVCRYQWWCSYHHHVSAKLCSIMAGRGEKRGGSAEERERKRRDVGRTQRRFSPPPFVNVATHTSFQNITITAKSILLIWPYLLLYSLVLALSFSRGFFTFRRTSRVPKRNGNSNVTGGRGRGRRRSAVFYNS